MEPTRATAAAYFPKLDPVIHPQARLRIMVTLAALGPGDRITFPDLQERLRMTAGNLSTHLRRLEEVGYVVVTKTFKDRIPVTYLWLGPVGRQAFNTYTKAMNTLLTSDGDLGAQRSR